MCCMCIYTFHGSLEGIDGVHLCNQHTSPEGSKALATALTHISIASHQAHLEGMSHDQSHDSASHTHVQEAT